MSIEAAMIARARPQMMAAGARATIGHEAGKGCRPDICHFPVALEPPFSHLRSIHDLADTGEPAGPIPEQLPDVRELIRLRVWLSPEQKYDWIRSELFLKQLAGLSRRVAFEIVGNVDDVTVTVLCHKLDAHVIRAAFRGEFECCELTPDDSPKLCFPSDSDWRNVEFREYYPLPPYSHLLTRPTELKLTPFGPLVSTLGEIPATALGIYQCVFQPVQRQKDWGRNVTTLLDTEYVIKSMSCGHMQQRYLQQAPSGDLRQMSIEVETKAHNDKPFFFAAVRTCVVGAGNTSEWLRAVSTCMCLFQHGSRPLNYVTRADWPPALHSQALRNMFLRAATYRPGFLVNSEELTGMVHMPPPSSVEQRNVPLQLLPSPVPNASLDEGTCVGVCVRAGREEEVRIPPDVRALSTHIIASSGMGKTVGMIQMLLQDMAEGKGIAFIDAHGDGVKLLMSVMPRKLYSRVIYFNPGDPEWIPLWNPILPPPGGNIYRLADDIIGVFKRLVRDWGDRMEHVIRNGLIGLAGIPGPTLLDLYALFRQRSPESELLRKKIIETTRDEPVRKFWQHDFLSDYKKGDLAAPKHKLSKLVSGGSVSMMLSQPESAIDFRKIMDTGGILLVDLSDLGAELRQMLGSFSLALLLTATLSRGENRRPFAIHADEAHLFLDTDAIEGIIAQSRKFGVSLCIAHQFLRQFGMRKVDALSTVGATLIGRVDKHDAQYFVKDLQDLVTVKDLVSLDPYEMIARIGTQVIRIRTRNLTTRPRKEAVSEIIAMSRRRYCRPVHEVEKLIARRDRRFATPFGSRSPNGGECEFKPEDLQYDEF